MTSRPMILGALIAGGAARRFGADKAGALLAGRPLWRHVADTLAPQVDALLVCGRTLPGLETLADRPEPGLGPLGGIAAALAEAAARGWRGVVCVPCDTPLLPADLVARLIGETPAYATECPVIGWWPATLSAHIDAHLAAGSGRSMRRWAEATGARAVDLGPIPNVNRAQDLADLNRSG